ncbi:MAG: transporter [Bdellovibrionales bacterium]|nr:transporter [Bdellovibrionales bacterium]
MKACILAILALLVTSIANAQNSEESTVTEKKEAVIAPQKPYFQTSYFYMMQSFKETPLENSAPLGNIPTIFPTKLVVQTNQLSLKANISNSFNLELIGQYYDNNIDLKQSSLHFSRSFNGQTAGMGDTLIGTNYDLENSVSLGLHLSIPTGDYQLKSSTGMLHSYPAQLGSGTYDFIPSISYKEKFGKWAINTKAKAKIRTGKNDLDYRLGDEIRAYATGSYYITRWLASNLTLYYKNWAEVDGYQNVDNYNTAIAAKGRATKQRTSSHSQHAKSSAASRNPNASASLSNSPMDPFAADGSRWSASLGLTAGIFFGQGKGGFIEIATPLYADQAGALEGLTTDWYVQSSIMTTF